MRKTFRAAVCAALMLALGGCPGSNVQLPSEDAVAIFHNGTGPMCFAALEWLAEARLEYPDLVVEEYLTTDLQDLALLGQLRLEYGESQGVSTTFEYLPIIFHGGKAFSGFNDEVEQELANLIARSQGLPS